MDCILGLLSSGGGGGQHIEARSHDKADDLAVRINANELDFVIAKTAAPPLIGL